MGTVDRMVFQLTLDHFGVSEAEVVRWGGVLVPARSYDEQLALYARHEVNALWQFMGIPSPSIQAAHNIRPLKALPFPDSLITALKELGWTAAVLPVGAYGIVEQAVPTTPPSPRLDSWLHLPSTLARLRPRSRAGRTDEFRPGRRSTWIGAHGVSGLGPVPSIREPRVHRSYQKVGWIAGGDRKVSKPYPFVRLKDEGKHDENTA
jgi:hypothetical protein